MNKYCLLLALPILTLCAPFTTKRAPIPTQTAVAEQVKSDWRARVTAARALDDLSLKKEAMLLLIREALSPNQVELSGELHPDQVHPSDNKPAPIFNFDFRLNQKTSAQARSGVAPRSLQNNFGYYFSYQGVGYVVLGPVALDPRGPVFTRLAAEHEMFHADHHVGDPRAGSDRELETWTTMFAKFFPDVHQFKQHWRPMLSYYDDATPKERVAAVQRLFQYRATAPAEMRAAFDEWLVRRKADTPQSKFVEDLEQAIAGIPAGS